MIVNYELINYIRFALPLLLNRASRQLFIFHLISYGLKN